MHLPFLSHVDQRMIQYPESSKDKCVPCAKEYQDRRQSQSSCRYHIESKIQVLFRDPPEQGGGGVEGVQARGGIRWHLEVLSEVGEVEGNGEEATLTQQLLVLLQCHQESHNCKKRREGGRGEHRLMAIILPAD